MSTKTQTGLVAFYDILGYANLLQNNEPEDIAKTVLKLLTNIKKRVLTEVRGSFKEMLEAVFRLKNDKGTIKQFYQPINQQLKNLDWLVFSDTILLTMPSSSPPKAIELLAFFVSCMSLQIKMFSEGLPLRGAIDHGQFYTQKTCFAGRAIIDAYNLCTTLDLSACVLTPKAREYVDDVHPPIPKSFDTYLVDYLFPTKTKESRLAGIKAFTADPDNDDIRAQVFEAFWKHNKDIPLDARTKIANTEQWLRFIKINDQKLREKS